MKENMKNLVEEAHKFEEELMQFLMTKKYSKKSILFGLSSALAMTGIAFEELEELDFESFKKRAIKIMNESYEHQKKYRKK